MPHRGILAVQCINEETDKTQIFPIEYDWATYKDMEDNCDGMQFDTLYEVLQSVIPEPWIIDDTPELIDSEQIVTEKAHVGTARLYTPVPKQKKKTKQGKVDL